MKLKADEIIEVIKNDATGIHRFFNNGEYCVIGGLGKACNITDRILSDNANRNYIFRRVTERFRITINQIHVLIFINNEHFGITERRKALIEQVNKWIQT